MWNSTQFLKFHELQFILYMWFWNWDCFKKLLIYFYFIEDLKIINHNNFVFRKCNKKKVELLSLVIWTVFSDHKSAEKDGMKVWQSCKATKWFEIKYVCLFFFTNAFVQHISFRCTFAVVVPRLMCSLKSILRFHWCKCSCDKQYWILDNTLKCFFQLWNIFWIPQYSKRFFWK